MSAHDVGLKVDICLKNYFVILLYQLFSAMMYYDVLSD